MRKKKEDIEPEKPRRGPPALTLDGREKQLVMLAIDLAEEQMLNKSISSQVHSHFLKLGTTRELLEQERLRQENELLKAKIKTLESMKTTEELYEKALRAMTRYGGKDDREEDD